jgi:anti-anti-sigma factor
MQVTTSKQGDVLVVEVHGRIDMISSEQLEKRLLDLAASGERWLALDLAGVDYVSSAGLRVFVLVARQLKTAGGAMYFCTPCEPVWEVFKLAGLTLRYDVVPTRAEAVARLTEASARVALAN